jgi:hypothetical protein
MLACFFVCTKVYTKNISEEMKNVERYGKESKGI